jgi:hypothetical protein
VRNCLLWKATTAIVRPQRASRRTHPTLSAAQSRIKASRSGDGPCADPSDVPVGKQSIPCRLCPACCLRRFNFPLSGALSTHFLQHTSPSLCKTGYGPRFRPALVLTEAFHEQCPQRLWALHLNRTFDQSQLRQSSNRFGL